jgi:hypothetical protein
MKQNNFIKDPSPKSQAPNPKDYRFHLGIWDLGFGIWDFGLIKANLKFVIKNVTINETG